MYHSAVRLATTIAAALAAAAALSAKQPGAQTPTQPVFRAGVELVTIDVVATGRDGAPVYNLKAEDFELFEDGVAQPIRTFEFINFAVPPPPSPLPPGVTSNDIEPGGIFAVVLDEIGIQVDDVQAVRRAAARFFETTLQENDHVAVVRSGANSGFFLTNDRMLALDAVSRTTGRRERSLGITEPGSDDSLAESTPSIETFGSGENSRGSIRVLLGVVERLRPIRARRKAIVWFSRGGDLPANITESFELQRNVGRDDESFARLINEARAANVAIYTVDPRGLQNAGADLRRDLNPMDTTAIRDLAAFTGGRSIISNDITGELARVAAENRAYYLLGYEPTPSTAKRPRPRKLRVTTRAPGVSLLHRSVFLPGSDRAAPTVELVASPLPVRELAIALAPAAVPVDSRKRGLVVPFEIGQDLRDGTGVEYSALALNAAGDVVSRASGRGKARSGRVSGEVRLAAAAGLHQVRLAARASDPEINGLAFASVRVPEGNAKQAHCGGFVIEQPTRSDALLLLRRDSPVTISTLVSAEKLTGALAFGLGPVGGAPQRLWPVTLGRPIAKGLWRVALSLNAPLPRGRLEVQLLHDGLLLHDQCLAQFASQ